MRATLKGNEHPTRCRCATGEAKPHMEKGGAIVWCNNCNKIIAIPIFLKRGGMIDLYNVTVC